MSALEATFALAEVGDGTRTVTNDLDFYVSGSRHEPFDQQIATAEGCGRFGLAALECLGDLVHGRDHSHSASAATSDRLEHHRFAVAEGAEELRRSVEVNGGLGAGQDGDIELDGERSGSRLVAEEL